VNRCVTDTGCLTCSLDTPQQGLDILENTLTTVCNETQIDINMFNIALNISSDELYDVEKNKYEVTTGIYKTADELIDIYLDLLSKYPRIMLIMNPIAKNVNILKKKLNSFFI
jgi:enolase